MSCQTTFSGYRSTTQTLQPSSTVNTMTMTLQSISVIVNNLNLSLKAAEFGAVSCCCLILKKKVKKRESWKTVCSSHKTDDASKLMGFLNFSKKSPCFQQVKQKRPAAVPFFPIASSVCSIIGMKDTQNRCSTLLFFAVAEIYYYHHYYSGAILLRPPNKSQRGPKEE